MNPTIMGFTESFTVKSKQEKKEKLEHVLTMFNPFLHNILEQDFTQHGQVLQHLDNCLDIVSVWKEYFLQYLEINAGHVYE